MAIDANVRNAFKDIIGKMCCRQRVGEWRSLSIGFGDKIMHPSNKKRRDPFRGEWEIGTWSAAWRIIQDSKVLCGSKDLVDTSYELDERLQRIHLGRLLDIETLSPLDIRVTLDEGILIDFICASTEDEEMFHIFAPDDVYIEFKSQIWMIGSSKGPWVGVEPSA